MINCKFEVIVAFLCFIHINELASGASILSWLTGGGRPTTPGYEYEGVESVGGIGGVVGSVPGRVTIPAIQNIEESGECSHWGDVGSASALPTSAVSAPTSLHSTSLSDPIPGELIGSHKTLPVGTLVAVTNILSGRTATVRVVSPRTIPVYGRVMDLSPIAFSQLANPLQGVFTCSVKVIAAPPRTEILTSHFFDGRRPVSQYSFVPRDSSRLVDVGIGSAELLGVGRHGSKIKKGLSTVTFYDPEGNVEAVAAPETY